MIVPKVATHSRAAMPSRLQHTNNPKDMPYRTVAITMPEQILALTQEVPVLTLEVPVPGYPLPLSPQSRGVTFSMLLPALPIPNSKIAGLCTLLINNLEWQSHQLSIPNLKILTTAIVVRTITSHLLGFFFSYENFLTTQRFLLQAPTTPRIHMVNEYTKTALPTVRFQ
jgi:hypothetical protein